VSQIASFDSDQTNKKCLWPPSHVSKHHFVSASLSLTAPPAPSACSLARPNPTTQPESHLPCTTRERGTYTMKLHGDQAPTLKNYKGTRHEPFPIEPRRHPSAWRCSCRQLRILYRPHRGLQHHQLQRAAVLCSPLHSHRLEGGQTDTTVRARRNRGSSVAYTTRAMECKANRRLCSAARHLA
jgi:hypothetical protein